MLDCFGFDGGECWWVVWIVLVFGIGGYGKGCVEIVCRFFVIDVGWFV